MPRRYWIYAAVFVLVLALAAVGAWQRAGAQSPGNYDCDVTLQPSGAFDAHCELSEPDEPEATVTGTATATLTLRPTSTPTVTPRPATATPVPVTATATATHTPAAAGALRLAVLGDSFYDEYRGTDNRGGAYAATTFNLIELLQRLRGVDLGPWGTWGEPRRTGYEYNWARSGATSYSMIQQGQHTGAAAQIRAGKIDCVFIGIGSNDYSPNFGDTYQRIYSGAMSDAALLAKERQHITDVTTAVETVREAGADCVIVALFTQWGLDPAISKRFPNAAGRQRVDDSIGRVNGGLRAMAASSGAVIVDQNAIGAQRILPQLDSAGNLTVGGEKISFLVNGDEPHHVKLGDGSHTGTVLSGLLANYYLIEPLNASFGMHIAPLGEGEILRAAGIRSGGTAVPTATATRAPPTNTPAAPTVTATPQPPAPPVSSRVNAPLIDAAAGDPALDANNWAIVWLGDISPGGGYAQLRLAGAPDGLRAYVQVMAPTVNGPLNLSINGAPLVVAYPSTTGWTVGIRGGRGWSASAIVPWDRVGGRPDEGDEWPLSASLGGATWAGTLRWGLPDYGGHTAAGAQTLVLPLTADAMVGGGTDCGAPDYPDYFPTWGSRNWGSSPYANVQAQWDVADWPCYAKYFAQWTLDKLPAGAQVVSATVTLRQFGNPGYGDGYAADGTKDTVMQVYEVNQPWQEGSITWDNAPAPVENTSRTLVKPIDVTCGGRSYCSPGIPYSFDVTEIVKRAQAGGRTWASMALYTAAGQYHSGKYFSSREGAEPPVVRIVYVLEGGQPTWTATATHTPTFSPGPGQTPTGTITPTPSNTTTPTTVPTSTSTTSASPTPSLPPLTVTSSPPTLTPTTEPQSSGCTRTVSPGGLTAAVAVLEAGNVLCLRDGTYTETIAPRANGTASAPITIRALNDGKVTIDGQGVRKPLNLGEGTGGGNWFVIEGLVLRNGSEHVAIVKGTNNVLRRISVYDANTNVNSQPLLIWGTGNTIESCIVAGSGRFLLDIYGGGNWGSAGGNVVRNCFVMWREWQGKQFCGIGWPGVFSAGIYNSNNNLVESSIFYGRSMNNFVLQANSGGITASNNRVLGNLSVLAGKDYDGSLWHFGSPTWPKLTRPQPTVNPYGAPCDDNVVDLAWPGQRVGMQFFGQGIMAGNVFRDNLVADAAALGFSANNPGGGQWSGTVIERLTAFGNGGDAPAADGGKGAQVKLPPGVACQNCCIQNGAQGEGARLQRYVNGQPTGLPLAPWEMEGRAQAELGVSVNAIIAEYTARAEAACR